MPLWFIRRASALPLAILLFAGCKQKSDKPAVVDPRPIGSATSAPADAAPPVPVEPAKPGEPMSIDDARAALPKIAGTVIIDLKQTSDKRQVHATWCIDGTGADDVAKSVGRWMAEAGYGGLSIRGDARKAGVSGDRGPVRLSMIVAASGAANCAAPQHYFASATIFRP